MLLIKTGNVFSADNIFNVDNIYVDTKKNKKREELFDNAVAEAFVKLTKRILIQEDREKTLKTPLNEIKRLVSHYEFIEDNESFLLCIKTFFLYLLFNFFIKFSSEVVIIIFLNSLTFKASSIV